MDGKKLIGWFIACAVMALVIAAVLVTPWYLLQRVSEVRSSILSSPAEIRQQTSMLRLHIAQTKLQLEDIRAAKSMLSYEALNMRQDYLLQSLETIQHIVDGINPSGDGGVKESIGLVKMALSDTSEHVALLREVVQSYSPGDLDRFLSQADTESLNLKISYANLYTETNELLRRLSSQKVSQLSDIAAVVVSITILMVLVLLGLGYSLMVMYRQKAELNRLSQQDELTTLGNRRSFNGKLSEAIAKAQEEGYKPTLLILDVDHFKAFNDAYGHSAGDDALVEVAKVLRRSARGYQASLFRIGGEEFACVLEQPMDFPLEFAEQLRHAVEETAVVHERNSASAFITVSIGVAQLDITEVNQSIEQDLFRLADQALYQAKDAGRNRVMMD